MQMNLDRSSMEWKHTIPVPYDIMTKKKHTSIKVCTVVFNVEVLKVFKGVFAKKNLKLSLREKTPLARKSSSHRRLTFHCTNLSSVLSI
jgi:hypothetical protein